MEDFSCSGTMAEAECISGDQNRDDDTKLRFAWFGENEEKLRKSSKIVKIIKIHI
jgi:hypothetical protein